MGKSTCGKTSSLKGLTNQEGVLYLNCEVGKRLPFRNSFIKKTVLDPINDVIYALKPLIKGEGYRDWKIGPAGKEYIGEPKPIHTVVLDSLTFLMDMYELRYVSTAVDGRKAWADYKNYLLQLFTDVIPKLPQNVIITAHTSDVYNEKELVTETKVKLKGSIMDKGIEAFFTDLVACKRLPLADLKGYENDLLHITEEEEQLGFKHVLQVRNTSDTTKEKFRPDNSLWSLKETFIDGNIQLVLNRLNEVYGE